VIDVLVVVELNGDVDQRPGELERAEMATGAVVAGDRRAAIDSGATRTRSEHRSKAAS
jgi:hypothetical protein